jgi:hypothetical protein
LKKDNKPSRRKATHSAKATDPEPNPELELEPDPDPDPDTDPDTDTEPDLMCDFWGNVLEPYADHPGQAFIAAQTFSILQQTLKSGPKGVKAVIRSFDAAIHLLFPLSHYYPPCEELYRLGVDGKLLPQYEPEEIVAQAKGEETGEPPDDQ